MKVFDRVDLYAWSQRLKPFDGIVSFTCAIYDIHTDAVPDNCVNLLLKTRPELVVGGYESDAFLCVTQYVQDTRGDVVVFNNFD